MTTTVSAIFIFLFFFPPKEAELQCRGGCGFSPDGDVGSRHSSSSSWTKTWVQTELSRAARLPPCPLPCLFPAGVTHFFPPALFLSPSLSCSAAGPPAHLEGHQTPFSFARPPASPPAAGCGTASSSRSPAAKPQSGRQAQGLLPWQDRTLPRSHPEGGRGGRAPRQGWKEARPCVQTQRPGPAAVYSDHTPPPSSDCQGTRGEARGRFVP